MGAPQPTLPQRQRSWHVLRYPDALWPNLAAASYALLGYAGGWALLFSDGLFANLVGVVLLAHAMVIAAYLIHDCAHNTIFADNRHNAWAGEVLSWLAGSAYGHYEDIRHKHFRHHVDRADVVAFDFRPHLARHPWLLRLVQALEWAYIPAIDLMMHALVLVLPFVRPERAGRRVRVIAVLLVRAALLGLVAWISLEALLLYAAAYMLFMHVMRFMDVHQHTYDVAETLGLPQPREEQRPDREFEHRNTFSNLISTRHAWLNLLTLNFGYHNAHHVRPTAPWYRLPRLHRELFGQDQSKVLPVSRLLSAYHRYRVARVLNGDPPDTDVGDGRGFIGVVGVSFLTAH